MAPLRILDCTFRDGGYYNNWDFDPSLVQAYLDALGKAKVDAVEMGFRSFPQKQFFGPNLYTTDDYLRGLRRPKGMLIGVMVNASDLIKRAEGPAAAVDLLFTKASRSPVDFVRVAVHLRDLEASAPAVKRLKKLGYMVGYNLMQSGGKSAAAVTKAARTVASWNAVDVLYFADSFGNMDAKMVADTAKALAAGWKGELGFHAHNNMSQGLTNALAAQAAGVEWLDGTILGMGRGAGNVQTEYLLVELARRGLHRRAVAEPVFSLVLDGFRSLQAVAPHIYIVRVAQERREAFMEALKAKGVGTGVHYIANHIQPHFKPFVKEPLPRADRLWQEIVTLPLHCGLSDADAATVIGAVRGFFGA